MFKLFFLNKGGICILNSMTEVCTVVDVVDVLIYISIQLD